MPSGLRVRTAAGLVLLAVLTAVPAARPAGAQSEPGEVDSRSGVDTVPATRPPQVANPDEVAEALDRHYPDELRRHRISGTTVLEMKVDRIGIPYDVSVADSASHPWFDEAALEVVETMEFEPGTRHGEPDEYTVEIPLRFQPSLPPELEDVTGTAACQTGPRLTNRQELLERLERAARRNEIVSRFEAQVSATLDGAGRVRMVELASSSGSTLFDQIALAVGSFLEFDPCMRNGTPRPSRVTVPVRTEPR